MCLGYVRLPAGEQPRSGDKLLKGYVEDATAKYEIEISGVRFAAKAALQPAYDPKGDRVKA